MSLRNILNTFNNNFSPISMNAIGNFVNLVNNLIGGYGTAANSSNEFITQEEAERRMKEHIDKYVLPGIKGIIGEDRWNQLIYSQKSALVSLAYNRIS